MAGDGPGISDDLVPKNAWHLNVLARVWSALRSRIIIDGFDFTFLILLVACALAYHQNTRYWAGNATIGNWQYGDAEFWWNGALQFAEGILRENVSLTYRMGYAAVAGLWIALFGASFWLFHRYLLVLLIVAWYALYLALRPSLGKPAAAVGILLAVLNPFTAEWLSISTSDSIGLLFNTWALVFLLVGLRKGLSVAWLAGGGLFIAFSSLTRPLMTPFLGAALLLPLLAIHVDWLRRGRAVMALLVAFVIPTFIWMGILHSFTNEWKLAGSDAATVYAASDPQIQQWNPGMFVRVEEFGRARFKVAQLTPNQTDQEFWYLTSENYHRFANYHLRRVVPHVVELANMSIRKASRVSVTAVLLRLLILGLFGIATIANLVRRGAIARGLSVLAIVTAWMYLPLTSWVVLLALLCGIPFALWNRSGWGAAVFTAYWLTGVGALYLVGGTVGPPLSGVTFVNALGYRLGLQFFFAADFMVLYLIQNICIFRTSQVTALKEPPLSFTGNFWNTPRRWASATVSAVFLIWLGAICSEVTAGAAVVTYKWVRRSTAEAQPFPDLTPVLKMCLQRIQRLLPAPRLRVAGDEANAILLQDGDSPYVLTTGACTDFIWNLIGQNRTKALISVQSRMFPFDFTNRMFVDFSASLHEPEWTRRQGAWLLRHFKDDPAPSNFPWYFSDVAVRAWVPLGDQGRTFDLTKARWFPVAKYASQLHSANALAVENGALEYSATSGTEHYPRRFAVHVKPEHGGAPPAIVIDSSRAMGARNLRFGWQCELSPGELPRNLALLIQSYALKGAASARPIERMEELVATSYLPPMGTVSLDLKDPPVGRVRVEFDGLRPGETVWIYEFNLTAEDWDW